MCQSRNLISLDKGFNRSNVGVWCLAWVSSKQSGALDSSCSARDLFNQGLALGKKGFCLPELGLHLARYRACLFGLELYLAWGYTWPSRAFYLASSGFGSPDWDYIWPSREHHLPALWLCLELSYIWPIKDFYCLRNISVLTSMGLYLPILGLHLAKQWLLLGQRGLVLVKAEGLSTHFIAPSGQARCFISLAWDYAWHRTTSDPGGTFTGQARWWSCQAWALVCLPSLRLHKARGFI